MTKTQTAYLESQFQRCPDWSTQLIGFMARRLGLKHIKVYKWNWDRKKKCGLTNKPP